MVLQKGAAVPIWGLAAPGEEVGVALDALTAKAAAGADGKWRVTLDLSQEGPGPFELTVQAANKITVGDVAVGEVWVASGQSNMTMALKETAGASKEIEQSADPLFRSYLVHAPESRPKSEPQVDAAAEGKWIVAGPAESGSFSAIGYYFGKTLRKKLQAPVGIIHTSVGGSAIESWLPLDGFDQDAELKQVKDRMVSEMADYPDLLKDYIAKYHAWETQYQRQDHPADAAAFAAPDLPTDNWKPVKLPGDLAKMGLPDSGAVWFRSVIHVPASEKNLYVPILLGTPCDFDAVYWNGVKIGETTADATTSANVADRAGNARRYNAPANLVNAGDNTLAIRLFSPGGKAGFDGEIHILSSTTFRPLPGSDQWKAKAEFELPPLEGAAEAAYPQRPLRPPDSKMEPAHLFISMIRPLIPYGIRGFIWDQGEANQARAFQYRTAFPLLIEGWRAAWGAGDLPFYYMQLQNGGGKSPIPGESSAAEMREAQAAALALPNTGLAVSIDIGEEVTHYRDKKDAGERLALPALAKTYGLAIPYAGPSYQSMAIEGAKIRITLANADDGLVARPLPENYQPNTALPETKPLARNSPESELEGFAICGADHRWVWAEAKIDGKTVVVSSPEVPQPVAVRYAWAENPTCNLYNAAGLPAQPFRTDDFPEVTLKARYGM